MDRTRICFKFYVIDQFEENHWEGQINGDTRPNWQIGPVSAGIIAITDTPTWNLKAQRS